MDNFLERVLQYPQYYRQFNCGQSLITVFNCPVEVRMMSTRFSTLWSKHNYLFYVTEGRRIWHTGKESYDIKKGSCVFVRKGGFTMEQWMDSAFCVVLFFLPDEFICNTLQTRTRTIENYDQHIEPVMIVEPTATLEAFFLSMYPYFNGTQDPDSALLELKFKELILNIADNPANQEILAYFCSLLHAPQTLMLQRIMEDNFCYNLKLETYAELSNRSLSAFKRDFEKLFQTSPGKWLQDKRLTHARHLLTNRHKTVNEAAFESGFESAAHFSRSFKKKFGHGPSEIKRQSLPAV